MKVDFLREMVLLHAAQCELSAFNKWKLMQCNLQGANNTEASAFNDIAEAYQRMSADLLNLISSYVEDH